MIDSFLRRHAIDVGRSLGLIGFLGCATRCYGVLGAALIGNVNIDLGIPISVIIALGLWNHRPWARTLLIVIGWIGTSVIGVLMVMNIAGYFGGLTLTLGEVVIRSPSSMQVIISGIALLPAVYLFLATLQSAKVREEFKQQTA